MEKLKFVVLGNSTTTLACADGILAGGGSVELLVASPSPARPDNSIDLRGYAKEKSARYVEIDDINAPPAAAELSSAQADVMLSTWPHLIETSVMNLFPRGAIGSHPTFLPRARGRHPLHWLIAMGFEETAFTLFKLAEGVDAGPILTQTPFKIGNSDIAGAVAAMDDAARTGCRTLVEKMTSNPAFAGTPQDDAIANTWRKRTPYDVIVDPLFSCSLIHRIVRSFAPPYGCAKLVFRRWVLPIVSSSTISSADVGLAPAGLVYLEPGRVLSVDADRISMRVEDGIVRLVIGDEIPDELRHAKYVFSPARYVAEFGEELNQKLSITRR